MNSRYPEIDGIERKVIEAYRTKNLLSRPCIISPDKGDGACCALGALLHGRVQVYEAMLIEHAGKLAGLREDCAPDFALGFDCGSLHGASNSPSKFYQTKLPLKSVEYFDAGWRTAIAVRDAGLRYQGRG